MEEFARGGSRGIGLIGFAVVWGGAALVAGSFLVEVPGRDESVELIDQPSPAWVSQAGVALLVIGGMIIYGAHRLNLWRRARSQTPEAEGARSTRSTSAWRIEECLYVVGLSVIGSAGLVMASVASPDSALRTRPLFGVAFMVAMAVWSVWTCVREWSADRRRQRRKIGGQTS